MHVGQPNLGEPPSPPDPGLFLGAQGSSPWPATCVSTPPCEKLGERFLRDSPGEKWGEVGLPGLASSEGRILVPGAGG